MTETGKQQATQEYSVQHRLMAGVLMILMPAFLAYFSVRLAMDALVFTDELWWIRIPLYALSGLSMFFALWLVVSPLRRRWKTGRFLLTRAERMAKMAEYQSKMGAGKPFGPQAKYWILPLILAMVFLILGLAILVAILRNICGWSDLFSQQLMIVPLLLAAAILAIPALLLFKAIRWKWKSGSFLPSQEEFAKARANCAKPKPLWQKILLAVLYLGVAVLFTAAPILRHFRHRPPTDSQWVWAVFWWVIAAIWTWQLFCPSVSLCTLPIAPEEPQTPPASENR